MPRQDNIDIDWEGVLLGIQEQRVVESALPGANLLVESRVADGNILNHSLLHAHVSELREGLFLASERRARESGATHRVINRDHLRTEFGEDFYLEVEFLGISADGISGIIFPGSYHIRLLSHTTTQAAEGVFTVRKHIASPHVPPGSHFSMNNITHCNISVPQR